MALRFIDKIVRVIKIATVLDGATANFQGSFVPAPARTGVLATQTGPLVAALSGQAAQGG